MGGTGSSPWVAIVSPARSGSPSGPEDCPVEAAARPPAGSCSGLMDVERELAELDRQVVRGSQFNQAVLQRLSWRLSGAEALLGRLVEALAVRGLLDPAAVGLAEEGPDGPTETAPDEPAQEPAAMTTAEITWPTIAIREDPPPGDDRPDAAVDCASRLHVCRAVCCRLKFPLSAAEVDAGVVKWDIGHPYIVRHRADGYCVHNDPATLGCSVYGDRPRVCRTYTCAGDGRIWADFDNMVLNHAWIAEHLDRRDDAFLVADDEEHAAAPVPVPVALAPRNRAPARRR